MILKPLFTEDRFKQGRNWQLKTVLAELPLAAFGLCFIPLNITNNTVLAQVRCLGD